MFWRARATAIPPIPRLATKVLISTFRLSKMIKNRMTQSAIFAIKPNASSVGQRHLLDLPGSWKQHHVQYKVRLCQCPQSHLQHQNQAKDPYEPRVDIFRQSYKKDPTKSPTARRENQRVWVMSGLSGNHPERFLTGVTSLSSRCLKILFRITSRRNDPSVKPRAINQDWTEFSRIRI